MLSRLFATIGGVVTTFFVALGTLLFGLPQVVPISPPPASQETNATSTDPAFAKTAVRSVAAPPPFPPPQPVPAPAPKDVPTPLPLPKVEPLPPFPPPAPVPKVSEPGPFLATTDEPPSDTGEELTQTKVFALTNSARAKEGLPALRYNTRLAAIAEAKAVDMIHKQYFAHASPEGIDVSALAEKYGYAYRYVGENLALGDFTGSDHVVTGWMNSPGHRANIVSPNYTEIGIAALRGYWNAEGREVWFAVQEFGDPMPDCPKPDDLTQRKIDIMEIEIDALGGTLENLKREIEAGGVSHEQYVAKVEDYNRIVKLYNDLIATTKVLVADYNESVKAYNTCIAA